MGRVLTKGCVTVRNPTHLLIGGLAAAVVTLSLSGCGTNASRACVEL